MQKVPLALLFLFSLVPCVFAQSEVGGATLNGAVTDPSGAAVAGAKVTIRSPAIGFTRAMESTTAGLFSFSRLPVGSFDLSVEMQGFKTAVRQGIVLNVGAVATLDISLELGTATETVSVTSELPVVEVTRTASTATVNTRAIADLPVNGRNFLDFTTLTPGVVRDPTRGGDLAFGGQRGPNNSLLVDGADSNNLFYGQATGRTGFRPYAFSQEAVQEFQVNTNSFPPEIGRASGGAINVITKSGTNEYHGSVFEYYRDKGMNANTFVNNRVGARKNPYHFNQFGGTLGGRIIRDKLFFFFSYDGQRNAQTQIVTPVIPPPASALNVFGKYLTPYQIGLNNNVGLVKVDWNATDRDRLSVRYNMSRYTGVNQESFGTNVAEEHSGNNEVNTDNVAAVYTRLLGADKVLEVRFNSVQDKQPGYANTTGPEVSIINGIVFGANNFSPRYTNSYAYQPTASLSYVRGRHAYKMGFDFNFVRVENYFPGFFAGGYTYSSYDAFLNGQPSSFRQSFPGTGTGFPISHPDVNEWAFYVQDAWRVTDRLTLNYGIRYDYFGYRQPTTLNNNAALVAANLLTNRIATDAANIGPRFGFAYKVTTSDAVVVRGGYGIYYARTPGLLLSTAILNNGIESQQYEIRANLPTYPNILSAPPGPGNPPDIYVTDGNYKTPRTQQFSLQTEFALGSKSSVTIGYLGVNGTHLTRTRDINLYPSIAANGYICPTSAACTAQTGSPVTYYRHSGASGPARPNPAFGRISLFDSGGNSLYHGGFVSFNRRFANNFQVMSSYTLSKVIDTTPDGTSVVPGNGGDDAKVAQDTLLPNLDRGPGVADIRHRFILSGVFDMDYAKSLGNPLLRAILSNWQLGMITQAQSGRRFQDIASGDPGNDGNNFNDRSPAVGRNTLEGPWFVAVDARLSKDIPVLKERLRVRLLGEAFNLTNRANFNGIQTTRYTFSGGFFRPTTNFLFRQTNFDPRIMQLAVKIIF
ncbi:MAG: TonB-dependent receptor [Bryobacterales bacterium]|nr:TonB-dependent receptor [Bryobacterales bacterium]